MKVGRRFSSLLVVQLINMGHTKITTITTTIENEHVDDGKKDMNDDDTYNDGQRNENNWRNCSIVSQSAGLAHQMLMLHICQHLSSSYMQYSK